MMFQNAEEVREHVFQELNLSARSITFHVFEITDDSHLYVGCGIVDCSGDLYDDDRFYDVGEERDQVSEIDVEYSESYMIGDGESEHADVDEAALLERIAEDSPSAFDEFIREYADSLASIRDFYVDNPAYDPCDADDYDEEDDEDE